MLICDQIGIDTESIIPYIEKNARECTCRNRRERINLIARLNDLKRYLKMKSIRYKSGTDEEKYIRKLNDGFVLTKELYWAYHKTGCTDLQRYAFKCLLKKAEEYMYCGLSAHIEITDAIKEKIVQFDYPGEKYSGFSRSYQENN